MSNVIISPSMNLPVPIVTVDPGPQWASDLNSCLSIIDGHTHSAGSGVQITPSALNLNADVTFLSNNAINLRSVRFVSQGSPLSLASDLGCLYESGVDLYYNDGNGNQIQMTKNGATNFVPSSIPGLAAPASASYSVSQGTFIWQQGVGVGANMDSGTLIVRYTGSYPSPAGNYVAIEAPSSLSSGYAIVLPVLPSTQSVLTIDSAGNLVPTSNGMQSLVPTGTISAFGGSSAPSGYLLCDGSAVSRTTYAALWGVIAGNYGTGNGSTTFNVPELRGMFLRGVSGASNNDPNKTTRTPLNPGGNPGNNVGSAQSFDIQGHTHTSGTFNDPGGGGGGGNFFQRSGNLNPYTSWTSDVTGGAETRPINVYVNYIIKT